VDALRLGWLDHAGFSNITVPAGAAAVGKRVSEIDLPQQCLMVSVRRGRKLQVANGYTPLRAGDQLTVFADDECLAAVHDRLTGSGESTPLANP